MRRHASMRASWTQRLGDLTNIVIGLLAATTVTLFFCAAPTDRHPDSLRLVVNAQESGDQQLMLVASRPQLDLTRGFNILPDPFPEPPPAFAENTLRFLFLTAPLPASAPGIRVLPYTSLPQTLLAFPEDIAQLIMIASSPGPNERDYLIRTLAFEASGETEIGKVAVAHVILNRKRSGRWGYKIADVVTSPWQFEPWVTRKREVEGLSTADPRYVEAAAVADSVLAGYAPDPTAGATHFLNPVIVRERRGGTLPLWADGDGRPIGRHVFYCPECDETRPTRAAVVGSLELNVRLRLQIE